MNSVLSNSQATPSLLSQSNLNFDKALLTSSQRGLQPAPGAPPSTHNQLLISKLEQDRELIKLQLKHNEQLMGARLAHMKEVADQRSHVERKVHNACVLI